MAFSIGATTTSSRSINNGVTTVDCHKQVRSWRLLRYLVALLIPTCNCIEQKEESFEHKKIMRGAASTTSTITGTIFGYRKGKVSFCIQSNSNSSEPILLLELAVPTTILAKEMRGGTLRIVLESSCSYNKNLFSTPLWTMYCNGRKVGYAVNRRPLNSDLEALKLMRSVSVGTGVINNEQDNELMYLRASFQRVRGTSNSESFHLIDPEGCIGQELSIFFFRSPR
ncbi:hypothetical protein HN51_030933 [Arachis hypogaea]|uniref:Protein MIZU-KUSSEI n=2 Tax=Arachis TaxID=3817 RepID=A0A445B981_ARAHY|nr:protein MIZU-KUSSEI 1-like [Arachis duranensis]XP_025625839.1 protein MIZU-KUSSEI 1-like [Arachis hypogaea]RYR35219.1 hypothetical protein Ahy_A10g050361 isoform B [Arachis hypogaea]